MKVMKLALQTLLLILLSVLGNAVCRLCHLSAIPGSIVGMLLLFVLLQTKIIKVEWISTGADWLISNMLLFFVPASLGITEYGSLVRLDGPRLVIIIAVSTALVMVSTGLLSEKITKWKDRREHIHALSD